MANPSARAPPQTPARFAAARAALTKSQLVLEVEVLRDHRKQLPVLEQLVRTGSIDPGDNH